ncbi:MAG TPA: cupin-like domain-containing protein [Anaerolineales bacterium]|nr:cupin-like domain-containing protein [Anaerolineales bacterium]
MKAIEELTGVDRAIFEKEILPANRPVVLRDLLRSWPAVQAGRQSHGAVVDYFKQLDTGGAVNAIVGRPEIKGRFFYSENYQDFNFGPRSISIGTALDTLLALAEDPQPPAIALQAMHVPDVMPSFLGDNTMPLLDRDVTPRVWISNRSMIATHFDNYHNLACVVGGSRRFTVFPPGQAGNLYVGPLLKTPGGSPISVVDLRQPDYTRFPKFRQALESAQEATLEPGDAIYIPILWWHGVESLEPLNILVNYWWNDAVSAHHKPILALMHCMVLMSGLPAVQREAWRTFFDHFAFQADGDPGAHLPSGLRDVMGDLSPADRDQVMAFIAERMKAAAGRKAG